MLADTVEGYQQQEKRLISNFKRHFGFVFVQNGLDYIDDGIVHWVERSHPRKLVSFSSSSQLIIFSMPLIMIANFVTYHYNHVELWLKCPCLTILTANNSLLGYYEE